MHHYLNYFTFLGIFITLFMVCKLLLTIENLKLLSNKILFVIFIIFGYTVLRYLFIHRIQELYDLRFPIVLITTPSVCAFPILFYLYIKTVLYNQKSFIKKDLYHLLVFISMYILYEYPYKLNLYNGEIVSEEYLYWSNYFRANNFPDWVLVIRTILNIVYSLLSYRILFKYFKTKSASIQINKVKKWLFTFANVKFILTIVNLIIVTFVLGLGKTNDFSIDVIILSIVLIMLTLILIVYKNKNILYNIPEYVNSNNYYNLKIKQEVNLNEVFKNITHEIFIQELFLNKDFKLSWLSDNLNIKQKHITLAISENGFENFSVYSNHFKIEKAKQLIKAGYLDNFSIEALSTAAGFKAVNSFYRVFKSTTGLTPSKYEYTFNKKNN